MLTALETDSQALCASRNFSRPFVNPRVIFVTGSSSKSTPVAGSNGLQRHGALVEAPERPIFSFQNQWPSVLF